MSITDYTIKYLVLNSWLSDEPSELLINWKLPSSFQLFLSNFVQFLSYRMFPSLLQPLRQWLNGIKIDNPQLAHRLCRLIPNHCPFARKITILGHTLITIPPLCKLNPLYDELMTLRFRALCYLADEYGEDISQYC